VKGFSERAMELRRVMGDWQRQHAFFILFFFDAFNLLYNSLM